MTILRSLHNIIIFCSCLLKCKGFITSHHFLGRNKIIPVGRKITVNSVDTLLSVGKDGDDGYEDDDQKYETLSSLSARLNDLAMIQIEEFQQLQKKQPQQSNSKNENDNDIEGGDPLSALSTEEELVRLDILHTRLKNIPLNRTFVAPSPIAGRGLFAALDCSEGDLLTCFPGDAMVLLDDDDNDTDDDDGTDTGQEWTVLWGDHVDQTRDDDGRDYVTQDWFLGNLIHAHGDNVGIVGVPSLDRDPAYLGHFANDGAPTELVPVCEEDVDAYVLASNLAANAVNEDIAGESHMVTVATRDIEAGEEIFVTYGPDYWLEQRLQRQREPPVLVDGETDIDIETMAADTDTDANADRQTRKKNKSSPSSSARGFG